MSDQLNMTEYPRQYPSPDYYYQRDYVPQENVTDKDIETRLDDGEDQTKHADNDIV